VTVNDNGSAKQLDSRLMSSGGKQSGPLDKLDFSFLIARITLPALNTTVSIELSMCSAVQHA